jgi:hypothetical protein
MERTIDSWVRKCRFAILDDDNVPVDFIEYDTMVEASKNIPFGRHIFQTYHSVCTFRSPTRIWCNEEWLDDDEHLLIKECKSKY